MAEAAPQMQVALLGAPPVLGELIASYFRLQLKDADVQVCLSIADLDSSADQPRAFVLLEPSAIYSVHNIARAVARVRAGYPQAPILVAAASPNPASAAEAFRCGAQGFVPRLAPISALADALRTVLAGGTCFPQTDCPDNQSELRDASPTPFQRSVTSPPRGRPNQPAHGPMLQDHAEGRLPPSSVELALISGETEAGHAGPRRRRRAADSSAGLRAARTSPTEPSSPSKRASEILRSFRALHEALDAAIRSQGADRGNIQLLDPKSRTLKIVAQRGFQADFLKTFKTVSAEDGSACARAIRENRPVVIDDVETDPDFAPYRAAAAKAGYRAVQSTPLLSDAGVLVGVLSTHFARPFGAARPELSAAGEHAVRAANAVAQLAGRVV